MTPRSHLPLTSIYKPIKFLLLGGGELGKEIAIEAARLGIEVAVVDRYDDAPAMQVARRRYVVDMTDHNALRSIVHRERPDVIIPEIEALNADALLDLEGEGYYVVPNARAVKIAMNRIELRRFAKEQIGLPTTRYAVAESEDEAIEGCERVGYPCIIKPEMSSSGHGHVKVGSFDKEKIIEAYKYAISHARGKSRRVIIEEFVDLETEFTILTYRYLSSDGKVVTETCEPVEHWRYGEYHYIESWQPSERPFDVLERAREIAVKTANALGGLGIFGVEVFLTRDGRVLFSEVAPRPHDTGMVTLVSQELSEFAIHVRSIIGLPVPKPRVVTPGASLAFYVNENAKWNCVLNGVNRALEIQGVDLRVFGKPSTYPGRRMAVVLARGSTVREALEKVRSAGKALGYSCTW